MRLPARVVVPLNSMCSSTCDIPAPSHLPSWMLPAMHQAWAETTGALWSSRTMMVSPFSSEVNFTPEGMEGISVLLLLAEDFFGFIFLRHHAAELRRVWFLSA